MSDRLIVLHFVRQMFCPTINRVRPVKGLCSHIYDSFTLYIMSSFQREGLIYPLVMSHNLNLICLTSQALSLFS